jgi:regulator of protease activity HflC (stomatin/prohibitin superfamily)
MKVSHIAVVILVVLVALGLALSVRVVKQYQLGVSFRLGRVLGSRRPGLYLIVPVVNALHRVSLRIVMMPIHSPGTSPATTSAWMCRRWRISSPVPASGAANG